MGKVELSCEKREGVEQFSAIDITSYTNQTFGMYGGREEIVTLQLPNRLIGVVIDRFGKEVDIRPMEEDCFRVRVRVALSGQFYGWLTGIGKEVEIISPSAVKESYQKWLLTILKEK